MKVQTPDELFQAMLGRIVDEKPKRSFMRRLFFFVGYPLRILALVFVCCVEPKMWERRTELLEDRD